MSSPRTPSTPTDGAAPRERVLVPVLAFPAALSVLVLVAAVALTGGAAESVAYALSDAGAGTRWAVPVLRLLSHASVLVLVGVLLSGLLPATRSVPVRVSVLAVALPALVWAVVSLASIAVGLSEVVGRPLGAVLDLDLLRTYVDQVAGARALLHTALLAGLVAAASPLVRLLPGRLVLLVFSLAALLPALRTGHAASAADHDLAVTAVSVHVVAAVLWIGGVGALASLGRAPALGTAARRFSRLALGCFVAVGASGAFTAWTRLPDLRDLWTTGYGGLLLAKSAALLALGVLGWLHRRRTLPALAAGDRATLLGQLATELALMAGAVALAVALTRTSV